MTAETVPASTRVHYKRVKNVDTDRLERRLAWVNENRAMLMRQVDDADHPGGRPMMRQLAREILTIEAELERRRGLGHL
jgi:hypothetical protein